MAYLVMRYFGVQVYSSVLGLAVAAVGIASAIGSVLLSRTLGATGHFTLFVSGSGISVLTGAALFLLLGRASVAGGAPLTKPERSAPECNAEIHTTWELGRAQGEVRW